MKKGGFLLFLGFLLIAGSLSMLALSFWQSREAEGQSDQYVQAIEELLPERSSGFPGMYSNPQMPSLQVEGEDFVALMEIPAFGTTLPVGSTWDAGKTDVFPCRFWGSLYDSTMIIGGSAHPGQFDFFDRLEPGAAITVTDMMGCEYAYCVARIDRVRSASYERLSEGDFPLVLFAPNQFATEYLIVRCDFPM